MYVHMYVIEKQFCVTSILAIYFEEIHRKCITVLQDLPHPSPFDLEVIQQKEKARKVVFDSVLFTSSLI